MVGLLEPHENTAGGIARDDGSLACIEAAGTRKPVNKIRFQAIACSGKQLKC